MLSLTKMNQTQKFHTSDLTRALEAQPHELRAWLRLEPLASRERKRRSATAYTALDVLFLVVIKKLDTAGFSLKALQTFSASIYRALQHPVAASGTDELMLYQGIDGSWNVGAAPADANAIELKIPLGPARLQVLQYTGALLISGQGELNLLASIQSNGVPSADISSGAKRASR